MTMSNKTSESVTTHRRCAEKLSKAQPVHCAVLTISDTRTPETDKTGPMIREMLKDAGHVITAHDICKDEPIDIERAIRHWIIDPNVHVIITTGGTGFTPRDGTIDVVKKFIDMPIEGFGELFRMISYQEIGAAAMLSNAIAGLVKDDSKGDSGGDTFLFAIPGSSNAVKTAMEKLIVPELTHLVMHRRG